MGKNKKSRKRPPEPDSSAVALAGDEADAERPGSTEPSPETREASGGSGSRPAGPMSGGGFFQMYKPGQGYYVRMGTAIGSGILLLGAALYSHSLLINYSPMVQLGVPAVLFAALGLALYWVVGVNRKASDFFIATEGEMKKVSWSSSREVVGSTKVVLGFTVLVATFLFVVDVLFMLGFSSINVLQIEPAVLLGFGS